MTSEVRVPTLGESVTEATSQHKAQQAALVDEALTIKGN